MTKTSHDNFGPLPGPENGHKVEAPVHLLNLVTAVARIMGITPEKFAEFAADYRANIDYLNLVVNIMQANEKK